MTQKTGFDRYFDEKMKNPRFAAEYRKARREVDEADAKAREATRER